MRKLILASVFGLLMLSGCGSNLKPIPNVEYATVQEDVPSYEKVRTLNKKYKETETYKPIYQQKKLVAKDIDTEINSTLNYNKKLLELKKRKSLRKRKINKRKIRPVKKVGQPKKEKDDKDELKKYF